MGVGAGSCSLPDSLSLYARMYFPPCARCPGRCRRALVLSLRRVCLVAGCLPWVCFVGGVFVSGVLQCCCSGPLATILGAHTRFCMFPCRAWEGVCAGATARFPQKMAGRAKVPQKNGVLASPIPTRGFGPVCGQLGQACVLGRLWLWRGSGRLVHSVRLYRGGGGSRRRDAG